MEKLTELYRDLQGMGASLFTGNYGMSEGSDAAAVCVDGKYGIFLDIDRIRTVPQEVVSVSHEWAHAEYDATYAVGADPLTKARAENRATKKQIERICPYDEMLDAMRRGYTTSYELAEQLTVTEEMIRKAYEYYTGPCGLSFSA